MNKPIWVNFTAGPRDIPSWAAPKTSAVSCSIETGIFLRPERVPGSFDNHDNKLGLSVWDIQKGNLTASAWLDHRWLRGLMALCSLQTRQPRRAYSPEHYPALQQAARRAAEAAKDADTAKLATVINDVNSVQLAAGMQPIPPALHAVAYKYLDTREGTFALYLFDTKDHRDEFCKRFGSILIEPVGNTVSLAREVQTYTEA